MVYRIYTEKKPALAGEAASLLADLRTTLGMEKLTGLRLLNRYDVENIDPADLERAIPVVFSEPQTDLVSRELTAPEGATLFAVAYLPGQFDMRADSAAQCIQLMTQKERPTVRCARVYVLEGDLSAEELAEIKQYVINPVESGEVSLDTVDTLKVTYDLPDSVPTVEGFIRATDAELDALRASLGLAMDGDDLRFCQDYFKHKERRDPTMTELRVIDTYWSDHCRHTTFLTVIDSATFEDPTVEAAYRSYMETRQRLGRTKPVTLMDIATLATRALKAEGKLPRLDESEEINACTVKTTLTVDGKEEEWLLLFKNETHNHPTEIEPFGGAATCIGGAIRDPLSGRSYVYAAMRVTGASDPTRPLEETIPGKLPQRKLVTTAAQGYSSYGNQIGLATGQVTEVYHPGYVAKHMEIGAVLGAAPASAVRRERPRPGDAVILLGGRTGRDGCGGATGSSKSHTASSLTECGAEVQKGNAPEERKLQRLFRDPAVTSMILRCNDFGAGGVSVAVGELADGLYIDLDRVPKKYEGLDGTELAISESQERMAVVVAKEDVPRFIRAAGRENLEANYIATVTEAERMVMVWKGKRIVSLSRAFLNSNGAEKHIDVRPTAPADFAKPTPTDFAAGMQALVTDLNVCSQRGLSERFDSTIGAGSVLMPFGGKYQRTPAQTMVHKFPVLTGACDDSSVMAYGYNPYISEASPFHGAYLAVVESVSKLIAQGASFEEVYLTFQEYFEKPLRDPARWGKPMAALLGAFRAQMELGIASIGGKDSMSGSFEQIDVPPTLVSFAVTTAKCHHIVTPELKAAGHKLVWLRPAYGEDGLPEAVSLLALFGQVTDLVRRGAVSAAYTPTYGGVAEALFKMALGNGLGVAVSEAVSLADLFGYAYGSFVLELSEDVDVGTCLGYVTEEPTFSYGSVALSMAELTDAYDGKLEGVYPTKARAEGAPLSSVAFRAESRPSPRFRYAKPRLLIPVFPGTNCEYDTLRAAERAGAKAEIFVVNNLSASAIAESARAFAAKLASSQILFVPGGFSGGDEPDGSGKFITAFLREPGISEQLSALLEQRDGLACGICNGFQALIKLGLVPYGRITQPTASAPTLTFNTIGRHQSRMVRTRVASNLSPWLAYTEPGEIYTVPISHGEGRFLCSEEELKTLIEGGQIATQYVDLEGNPTYDVDYNPNGSTFAVEGITSADGRVLGKMGHSERIGDGLYRNVEGKYDMQLFRGAVDYYN